MSHVRGDLSIGLSLGSQRYSHSVGGSTVVGAKQVSLCWSSVSM